MTDFPNSSHAMKVRLHAVKKVNVRLNILAFLWHCANTHDSEMS